MYSPAKSWLKPILAKLTVFSSLSITIVINLNFQKQSSYLFTQWK